MLPPLPRCSSWAYSSTQTRLSRDIAGKGRRNVILLRRFSRSRRPRHGHSRKQDMCRFCQHDDEGAGPAAPGGGESPGTADGVRGIFSLAQASLSSLQLALELVQETPIGAFGDDLIRARLDEAGVAQAQRIKAQGVFGVVFAPFVVRELAQDRKSTRLNSSHLGISYAVFCLK